jgi:uncharacterized protein
LADLQVSVMNKPSYTLPALLLSIGLVVAASIVGGAAVKARRASEGVTVKGLAVKRVVSDAATWEATLSVTSSTLEAGFPLATRQVAEAIEHFKSLGAAAPALEVAPITTQTVFEMDVRGQATGKVSHYRFHARFSFQSTDTKLVEGLSRGAVELLGRGIELVSSPPRYYFSELEDQKLDLLGAATANARERADVLIRKSGGTVGRLLSASQGVFQITPPLSTDFSDYGSYDTTTVEKDIRCVVTTTFAIE